MGTLRGVWQGTRRTTSKTPPNRCKSAVELVRALAGYLAAPLEIAGIYEKTEQNVQKPKIPEF